MELEDESDAPVSELSAPDLIPPKDVRAVEEDAP
jgi:hypothetical protein